MPESDKLQRPAPSIPLLLLQPLDGKTQATRQFFLSKRPFRQNTYTELDLFRQQIEQNREGLHQQPYTINKSSVSLYRMIFFGFACLFAILGIFVACATSTLTHPMLNFSLAFKGLLTFFCGILSLAAFFLAITLRPEREAVMQYARMAKSNLKKAYGQKKSKLGLGSWVIYGNKAFALKQLHRDYSDKVHEKKEEAMHLILRIASTSTLDTEQKEILYNQAIAEFNDKLSLLVHSFKQTSLPRSVD